MSADAVVDPIFIDADDGLTIFTSLGHGEGYMEEPDVETGVYGLAFDAVGHRVAIGLGEIRPHRWLPRVFWGQRPVELTVDLDAPPEPEALAALLQERLGDPCPDLATLVERAVARFGIVY